MIWIISACVLAVGIIARRELREARKRRDEPARMARVYGFQE